MYGETVLQVLCVFLNDGGNMRGDSSSVCQRALSSDDCQRDRRSGLHVQKKGTVGSFHGFAGTLLQVLIRIRFHISHSRIPVPPFVSLHLYASPVAEYYREEMAALAVEYEETNTPIPDQKFW